MTNPQSNDPKYISFKSDQRQIYFEFFYLGVLFILAAVGLMVIYYAKVDPVSSKKYLYSFVGAFVGGLCFDAKWFYRVTARGKFNQYMGWQANKFYWRMIIPFLSAFVGFALYIIVVSRIIPFVVLDANSNQVAFGFSFIFGYFSDVAIGKISDWINSLAKKENTTVQPSKAASPYSDKEELVLESCTMCAELQNRYSVIEGDYCDLVKSGETIIYRGASLSVVPSVGPLNEQHTLILSNAHLTSISQVLKSAEPELLKLMEAIKKYNRDKFNVGTVFFEHGSCHATKNDSSCIEHAHLHCLGFNEELKEQIEKVISLKSVEPSSLASQTTSYLLYVDQSGKWWINDCDPFESQLIRRLYCTRVNKTDWNWRQATNVDTIISVINNYKSFGNNISTF